MRSQGFCLVHLLQVGSRYTRLCEARHDIVFHDVYAMSCTERRHTSMRALVMTACQDSCSCRAVDE